VTVFGEVLLSKTTAAHHDASRG